jgi:hypothetical protein
LTDQDLPARHVIQLTDVWLERATMRRRPCREGDPPRPNIRLARQRFRGIHSDGTAFGCSIELNVTVPVLESEQFGAVMKIAASFASEQRIPTAVAREFCRDQSLYLLWPFARSYFHQLAQAGGVTVPPLPLIVRPPLESVQPAPLSES